MVMTKNVHRFDYTVCRNISCPEDEQVKRKVYAGHAPATSFIDLDDNENVREYLLDAEGRQVRKPTSVHHKIRSTLENEPDKFSILNGGIVIVTRDIEVDDKNRVMKLYSPSIINGSQTRGELKRYIENAKDKGLEITIPNVFYQIIVTSDDDLIAEVSIARNFQNDVKPISIVGRLGLLDELQVAIKKYNPDWRLRMSETDLPDAGFVDTEKLVQVMFALLPDVLAFDFIDETGTPNKVFCYSKKSKCLKLFQKVYENKENPKNEAIYKFFLDICGQAWTLYNDWKVSDVFKGSGIRAIQREGEEIREVPDGIVFPILASLAAFAKKKHTGWTISIPNTLDPKELVQTAKQAYQEIAKSNPQLMGKSKACYSSLARVTSIYARLSK